MEKRTPQKEVVYVDRASDVTQKEIEKQRYKQDCRKRALEMAHADNHAGKLREGITLKAAADEYYNWLISIPEK